MEHSIFAYMRLVQQKFGIIYIYIYMCSSWCYIMPENSKTCHWNLKLENITQFMARKTETFNIKHVLKASYFIEFVFIRYINIWTHIHIKKTFFFRLLLTLKRKILHHNTWLSLNTNLVSIYVYIFSEAYYRRMSLFDIFIKRTFDKLIDLWKHAEKKSPT